MGTTGGGRRTSGKKGRPNVGTRTGGKVKGPRIDQVLRGELPASGDAEIEAMRSAGRIPSSRPTPQQRDVAVRARHAREPGRCDVLVGARRTEYASARRRSWWAPPAG